MTGAGSRLSHLRLHHRNVAGADAEEPSVLEQWLNRDQFGVIEVEDLRALLGERLQNRAPLRLQPRRQLPLLPENIAKHPV